MLVHNARNRPQGKSRLKLLSRLVDTGGRGINGGAPSATVSSTSIFRSTVYNFRLAAVELMLGRRVMVVDGRRPSDCGGEGCAVSVRGVNLSKQDTASNVCEDGDSLSCCFSTRDYSGLDSPCTSTDG